MDWIWVGENRGVRDNTGHDNGGTELPSAGMGTLRAAQVWVGKDRSSVGTCNV